MRKPEAYDLVNFGYTNESIDKIASSEVSTTKTPNEENSRSEEVNPCYEYFLVDKYSFMDSICYRFAYMDDLKVDYAKREIIFSPDQPGVLFSIQFKDSFDTVNRIRVMMHPNDWLPWIEAAYTSYVFRLSGKIAREISPVITVVFTEVITLAKDNTLSPPLYLPRVNTNVIT